MGTAPVGEQLRVFESQIARMFAAGSVAAFTRSTIVAHRTRHASIILLAGSIGLTCCHSASTGNNETAAQASLSLRVDSLEARVSSLEGEMKDRANLRNREDDVNDGAGTNETASFDSTDNEAANEAFDDQDYDREIQALCASKGVDCSQ